jgi:hypothetical protein
MVVRVVHDQLYLFLIQHVQALQLPLNYQHPKAFCEWPLQQDASPTFLS